MKVRYLIIILLLIFAFECLFVLPDIWGPGQRFLAAVFPSSLINSANQDRQTSKLPILKQNSLLMKAAQMKAEDMAKRGYFSHEGPLGESPWSWLDRVGYPYVYAGENLAINFSDSADIHKAWLNSPKHRDNIFGRNFSDVGIGTATGEFEGRTSIFVVQFFGSTEESLVQAVSDNRSLLVRSSRLLSAVSSLADDYLTQLRHWTKILLQYFGYQPTTGQII